ncbi:adenosylcobinamide-phosphate synthase CbiB [Fulvimarina sp. 2208YS6-2-32]|uniref:Cobalamin biosynthesis protein CobD n=1 Tax=Fulvimarina uroteuthidis TaxID=3098149 RepID=A0ABU5I0U0_9HYPH|nr:adenosylcobinamide-phosphate synthase CbiB [Fulvimarina sp. 2208YS6-2-32]MDY8108573.1 adenosylcobinamide-phosphate synthase CbiB [Fulvimarina sp. 2208YS6-2-32]
MTGHFAVLLFATILDRVVGDPPWLWRRIPHPVVAIGAVISALDGQLNDRRAAASVRRRNGVILAAVLVLGGLFLGLGLASIFALFGLFGALFEIALVAVFLAQKSLTDHVRAVREALAARGLAAGRAEVAMIVGRDVSALDEAGIVRAAIESLAENASDGIVAPFFWYLVLGLPGLLVYKAINTADSMVGHLDARYRDFGWASARLDDLLNLVPARLTAWALIRVSRLGGRATRKAAMAKVKRDAALHRSPNAGWPETAMGLALDLALGGPRRYGSDMIDAPVLNAGGRHGAAIADIDAALDLTAKLFNRLIFVSGTAMLLAGLASLA